LNYFRLACDPLRRPIRSRTVAAFAAAKDMPQTTYLVTAYDPGNETSHSLGERQKPAHDFRA
jgi:hypothetical protein